MTMIRHHVRPRFGWLRHRRSLVAAPDDQPSVSTFLHARFWSRQRPTVTLRAVEASLRYRRSSLDRSELATWAAVRQELRERGVRVPEAS